MKQRIRKATAALLAAVTLTLAGCGLLSDNKTEEERKANEQRTRDEVAKATERAKPELQKAGRELKDAAKTAAEQARAAAQGVKDGWQRSGHGSVDVNSASQADLERLPGITPQAARKIIAERPYNSAHDLLEKGVVSRREYDQIRDRVVAH